MDGKARQVKDRGFEEFRIKEMIYENFLHPLSGSGSGPSAVG